MKYEGSRTGRLQIAQVPLFEWSEDEHRFKVINESHLSCADYCLICKDIQRNFEMNPSSTDPGLPCAICPDCSDFPEWTI